MAFRASEPCHVTLKVRRELPSLRLPQIVRAVEATFRQGLRSRSVPARPLLAPGRSRAPPRGSERSGVARARDEVDRLALRARREPGAEAARAGALRSLPLPGAQDADRGAERAPLRAAQRAQALGAEPAAAREGRGEDPARRRSARCSTPPRPRAGSTAGRARSRSIARRPARWRGRRPGSSVRAGGSAAGSSTRTRSPGACASDRTPEPRAPGPPLRDLLPSKAFRLRPPVRLRSGSGPPPPQIRSSSRLPIE